MIFKSKIDSWIYLVIAVEVIAIIAAIVLVLKVRGPAGLPGIVAPAVIGLGVPLWLLYSIRYEVTADKLIVRAAWKTWEIPKVSIQTLKPSRSMLSSPALSLDRLEIRYDNDDVLLVSPQDKQAFADALGVPLSK
ncbi:MAG TPA: PH domain-containing protein [Candidatus Acidoferrum sp.]|nr:PH domain-containing protein [Candidatus Acidoferrum sp.]